MNQGIFLPPLALGTVTAPFSRGEEGSAQGPLQLQMTHARGAPSSQLQQDEVFPKFFSELVLIQISITQSSLIATSTAQPRLGGVLQRQKSCRPKRTLPRCARACPLPPGSTLLPLPQPSPHGEAKPLLRVPRRQRGWEKLLEEQTLHTRLGPGALPVLGGERPPQRFPPGIGGAQPEEQGHSSGSAPTLLQG